jgi:hypothetical protein
MATCPAAELDPLNGWAIGIEPLIRSLNLPRSYQKLKPKKGCCPEKGNRRTRNLDFKINLKNAQLSKKMKVFAVFDFFACQNLIKKLQPTERRSFNRLA